MISVPIRYVRADRVIFIQKLQHALPSFVVLVDGLSHLSDSPHGADLVLGVLEVAAALGVMGSVVRGFLRLRRPVPGDPHAHAHHGIDWIDIFIGAMLMVEAYAKYHSTGRVPRATIALSLVMFAIGLAHAKLAAFGDRRRSLHVRDDGISVPGRRPFMRFNLKWADVASIDVGDRYAVITSTTGKTRRLDFTEIRHPNAVRDALNQAQVFLQNSRPIALPDQ